MNKLNRRRLLAAAAAVLTLAGCATSPTGRSQLMLVSPQEAVQASRAAYVQQMQRLEAEGKLSDDPQLIQRVNLITGRLVAQAIQMRPDTADWDWSVEVIEDPDTVNAWCMAGGRMAIYTGLIEKTRATDDEIAQVMGHEISHALANHTAERMSIAIASQAGILAAGVATGDGRVMAGAAAAAALAVNLPNSRVAETEADRIGIELAAKAGYDPRAAASLWKKMGEVGGEAPPQFLSTHPAPQNRQQTLARLAPEMMPYYEAPGPRPVHVLQPGSYRSEGKSALTP
ncbi:MAG: M48 family metallopeptidase [Gammaproteobacteria bacterium]